MGIAPIEGPTQVSTELAFEGFIYSKRIKPLLKREVNNETSFFTSLKSRYEINIIACYICSIYTFLVLDRVTTRNNLLKSLHLQSRYAANISHDFLFDSLE